uniref:Si:dkey-119f1.1 n=1 Tax=Eptatretus burgeri TaxID=7764 RepID=A0A8C4Q4U3_EPTBU
MMSCSFIIFFQRFGQCSLILNSNKASYLHFPCSSGKVISIKRQDLNIILDHFNIQVDNPICMLNQEMSKCFLQTKNPSEKYKFFMKATQLEQMHKDYEEIAMQRERTQDKVENHKEVLLDMNRMVQQKKEHLDQLVGLEDLKKEFYSLENQRVWAEVRDVELEYDSLKRKVTEGQMLTDRFEQKEAGYKQKQEEAEAKLKDMQARIDELLVVMDSLRPQYEGIRKKVDQLKRDDSNSQIMLKGLRCKMQVAERDNNDLIKKLEAAKNSEHQNMAAHNAEHEASKTRLEAQLRNLKEQKDTVAQQMEQFKHNVQLCSQKSTALRNELVNVQRVVQHNEQRHRELSASRTDRLSRFGHHMPRLSQLIDDAHKLGRFQRKPIGPLGSSITIRDPELALAAECCLKEIVYAFCCHSHQDEHTLESIIRGTPLPGHRPEIIVTPFLDKLHDISTRSVKHPEFPSLFESLEINNNIVANILIDMRSIETVLLIKDNRMARQVMIPRPPRNCTVAYTAMGDQVFSDRYYSGEMERARFLSSNVEEQMTELQRELVVVKGQVNEKQQEVTLNDKEKHSNTIQLTQKQAQMTQIQDRIVSLSNELRRLQDVEPEESSVYVLEEELQDMQEQIVALQGKFDNAANISESTQEEYRQMKQEEQKQLRKINVVKKEEESVRTEYQSVEYEIRKCKCVQRSVQEKKRVQLHDFSDTKKKLMEQEQKLQEVTTMAQRICPDRVKVTQSTRCLLITLEKLKARIDSTHHPTKKEKAEVLSYLSELCKMNFDAMLLKRKYSGSMAFDHKNCTLMITVHPNDRTVEARTNTNTLSGGERSFSTVCFILALWHCTESPFRCLDEYDVFMDMVTRRMSMDMMLQEAENQRHRQFMFITPLPTK